MRVVITALVPEFVIDPAGEIGGEFEPAVVQFLQQVRSCESAAASRRRVAVGRPFGFTYLLGSRLLDR